MSAHMHTDAYTELQDPKMMHSIIGDSKGPYIKYFSDSYKYMYKPEWKPANSMAG